MGSIIRSKEIIISQKPYFPDFWGNLQNTKVKTMPAISKSDIRKPITVGEYPMFLKKIGKYTLRIANDEKKKNNVADIFMIIFYHY